MSNTVIVSVLTIAAVVLCVVTGAPSGQTSVVQENSVNQANPVELSARLNDLQKQMAELQIALLQSSPQHEVQTQLAASASQVDKSQPEQVWPFYVQPENANTQIVRTPVRRQMSFQPMKRMVSWQPMKRSPYSSGLYSPFNSDNVNANNNNAIAKEQVMLAIENELAEVLRAGEKLGISADDILAHLRARNLLQ